MKILEVVVDRILNSADRRAEISARLMLSLLNGVTLPETHEFLAPHLPSDGFVLVSVPVADGRAIARVLAVNKLPIIAGLGANLVSRVSSEWRNPIGSRIASHRFRTRRSVIGIHGFC
jgi:phosphohistidine phosphatase SixA